MKEAEVKTETEQKVLEWIDRRQGYLTVFLRNLIAIPSVTGEELEIQKFIARKLDSMGLEVDLWEPDHEQLKTHPAYLPSDRGYKDRPNVVGRYRGTGGGRSLLFNGHVDVIPAGAVETWEHPPWAGDIQGKSIDWAGFCLRIELQAAHNSTALEALFQAELLVGGCLCRSSGFRSAL